MWAGLLVACLVCVVAGIGAPASAQNHVIWQRIFSGPGGQNSAFDVAVAPNGSAIYVTGIVIAPTDCCAAVETIAYDPDNGDTLWETRYSGGLGDDGPSDIAVSPDGATVYVTGATNTSATEADFLTLALDASDGNQRWAATFGGSGDRTNESADAVAVSPDGQTVVVTGQMEEGTSQRSIPLTVAYDAASGSPRWMRSDPSALFGGGRYVRVSPDGANAYVAAQFSEDGETSLTRTYAYGTATGKENWRSTFRGGAGGSGPNGIVLAPDGSRLYLTATTITAEETAGTMAVVSYDASTGAQVWKRQTPGFKGLGASAAGIAVTPDGSTILVGGSTNRFGNRVAAFLWAIDSAGDPQWRRVHQQSGDMWDAMNSIDVSPDGSRVYLSGNGCPTIFCDGPRAWLTLAYSLPDGTMQWSARYAGPDADNVESSLAVTPDSTKLVVVGRRHSQIADTNSFATIVYAA
jgi:DNA-binding beta-propeller fold protein YncE